MSRDNVVEKGLETDNLPDISNALIVLIIYGSWGGRRDCY